jgi:hypothetical protein
MSARLRVSPWGREEGDVGTGSPEWGRDKRIRGWRTPGVRAEAVRQGEATC